MNSPDKKRFPASWYRKDQGVACLRGKAGFFLEGGEIMNEVKFKTLNAEGVHRKLLAVAERLLCVEQIIDKVVNEVGSCHVLPVIGDASYELAEVYEDLQLNGHKEGQKKKSPLKILPPSKKER